MAEEKIEILKRYGAEDISPYCLISNYGYTFRIGEGKFDIRFWANCYGYYIGKWQIHPCTDVRMDKELQEKIEAEFNSLEA